MPEVAFAARVPREAPPPPRPRRPRHVIFYDVENTSSAGDVGRVMSQLAVDRITRATELIAVGNWRVIGQPTARLLARDGAQLVHSAPSVGVRDWSDLRIAVAAGVWLASAEPGDLLEVVSDDQAFDAVGDVAATLGVQFRRFSVRALLGGEAEAEAPAEPSRSGRSRRRRRGGGRSAPPPARTAVPVTPAGAAAVADPDRQTAPYEEILAVVRRLVARDPARREISIDALSNALKAEGFSRPPGSPRLITRLRRIKELQVAPDGAVTLASPDEEPIVAESAEPAEPIEGTNDGSGAEGTSRRRRRRGGRRGGRRRGGRRRNGAPGGGAAPPAE